MAKGPSMTHTRAWPDLVVGCFVVLIGAACLWQAAVIPASPLYGQMGPKAVPYAVGGAMVLLGLGLSAVALRGGWSADLPDVAEAPPANPRAMLLMGAGLAANLVLIGPAGFSVAATAQFVLVCAAFGSRKPVRDFAVGAVLSLGAFFLFVQALGVNIGAGPVEGAILSLFGQEAG